MRTSTEKVLAIAMSACVVTAAFADAPRTRYDYADLFAEGLAMNLRVTHYPLSRHDIDRWADILNASDEQRQFMEIQYERFVERHNAFMDREMPKHIERGLQMGELFRSETPGANSLEFAAMQREMDQHNARIRRQLTSIERSFIDAIQPILTEVQLNRVPILHDEARRRHCRWLNHLRWSNLELRPFWEEFAAPLASPAEAQLIEAILKDYDSRLTTLYCKVAAERPERAYQLTRNRFAMESRLVTPDEGRARYRQLMNRQFDSADRIRRLNKQTADSIVDVLSEDAASPFMEALRRTVFPEVYPDDLSLHELFEALQEDEDLDDEVGLHVDIAFDAYVSQYDRINQQLEDICIEWNEQSQRGIVGYERQFLPDELEPLIKERTELSRTTLTELEHAIGSATLEPHAHLIPDWEAAETVPTVH